MTWGARQNPFSEGRDALYVEFIDGLGVTVDLGERQFLAQLVALPAVPGDALGTVLARSQAATAAVVLP